MTEQRQIESKGKQLSDFMSEATVLALITATAYWIAFAYEAGYLAFYRVPLHLARVGLDVFLVVVVTLYGVLWLLLALGNLLSLAWPVHPALQIKALRVCWMLLVPIWHLANYGLRREDWILYITLFTLIGFFEVLWPLFIYRNKKSLREKIISDEIAEAGRPTILLRLHSVVGPMAYSLIIVVIFGGWLSYSAGRAAAVTQKQFFLWKDRPDIAVVRTYPDLLICVPFNREDKKIKPQLILRRIADMDIIELVSESIGPLQMEVSETPINKKMP